MDNTGGGQHQRLCVVCRYEGATIRRLLKITGLFCRTQSLLHGSFAKESYNLFEPTNLSHPIRCIKVCELGCVQQGVRVCVQATQNEDRLQQTATDYNRLQQTATDYNKLHQIATDCNRLQQTATHRPLQTLKKNRSELKRTFGHSTECTQKNPIDTQKKPTDTQKKRMDTQIKCVYTQKNPTNIPKESYRHSKEPCKH